MSELVNLKIILIHSNTENGPLCLLDQYMARGTSFYRKHDHIQGAAKKIIHYENCDISTMALCISTQFSVFAEEEFCHICCKFHCNIWFGSKVIAVLILKCDFSSEQALKHK
jgi:hypothetical protein